MSAPSNTALWLADFHVMAMALLASALVAMLLMKQPARRMAVAKATLAGLAALAVLCALPGWSVVHLASQQERNPIERSWVVPAERPVTQFIPHINVDQIPPPETRSAPMAQPRVVESSEPLLRRISWTTLALSLHATGSLAVAAWLVSGALMARRIVRRAYMAPSEWCDVLAQVVGDKAPPELLVSGDVTSPVAISVWRPKVLLPNQTDRSDSSSPLPSPPLQGEGAGRNLTGVLAHEWAHIRNGDLWTLAASRWLLVLLWPQPLFWWLRRLVRLDQETLADAAACEAAGRLGYAEQLLEWARQTNRGDKPHGSLGTSRLAGAVGLWEGPSQLKRRVAILLNEKFAVMRSCSRRWRFACLAASSLAAIGLSLVTLQPATQAEEKASAGEQSKAEGSSDTPQTKHASVGRATYSVVQLDEDAQPKQAPPPQYKKNGLKVTVVDSAGKPIPGVEVLIYHVSFNKGTHKLAHTTHTVEQGVATFDDLLPAEVVAKYEQAAKEQQYPYSQDDSILIALRKPGLATALTYQWGQSLAVNGSERRLMMRPAAELRGRVTDPEGRPVSGATVVAGRLSGSVAIEGVNEVKTDDDGRYVFTDRLAFNAKAAREKEQSNFVAFSAVNPLVRDDKAGKPEDPADDLSVSNLMVTHPDFAATHVEGGDVPGVTDVQMLPAATIEGRVVWHDSGKPASGIAVKASGKLTNEAPAEAADIGSTPNFHAAATTTDAEGRYRLTNLPPGTYSVWADPGTQLFNDAEWISRGHDGLEAKAGKPAAQAPDLIIGPGGTIRGQLVDADTGQPLKLSEAAHAQPFTLLVDGPQMQPTLSQRVPVTPDGKFEMRTPPGKVRTGVFVYRGRQLDQQSMLYQSDDDVHQSGEVFDLRHGETIEGNFPVWTVDQTNRWRERTQQAYLLLSDDKLAEAIDAFTAMHMERPDDLSVLYSRGTALKGAGRYKEALADFEKALTLQPEEPSIQLLIVDLLATAPDADVRDGARAVKLAEQLVESVAKVDPGNNEFMAHVYSRLAAAHAEVGDFDKAIEAQQQAIERASSKSQEELQQRLELYKSGKPFRREPPPSAQIPPKTSQAPPGPWHSVRLQAAMEAPTGTRVAEAPGLLDSIEKDFEQKPPSDLDAVLHFEKPTSTAAPK